MRTGLWTDRANAAGERANRNRARGDAADSVWVERPEGRLGRGDLVSLAARLAEVPVGRRTVVIDWADVRHLDFRGLPSLADGLQALRRRGIEVRSLGCDPYLRAILRFALLDEEEGMEESRN